MKPAQLKIKTQIELKKMMKSSPQTAGITRKLSTESLTDDLKKGEFNTNDETSTLYKDLCECQSHINELTNTQYPGSEGLNLPWDQRGGDTLGTIFQADSIEYMDIHNIRYYTSKSICRCL